MRVLCLLLKDPSVVLPFAEACLNLTPDVAIRDHEAVFIDVSRCENLYTTEGLHRRLAVLLKRFKTTALVAEHRHASMALAYARYGTEALPIDALMEFISPFHVNEEHSKQAQALVVILKRLGLVTLHDFKKFPGRKIPSHLGGLAIQLHQAIHGSECIEFPRLIRSESIIEECHFPFDASVETLEPMLFSLKAILQKIATRLSGRGERVTRIKLELLLEKTSVTHDSVRDFVFCFTTPQGSAWSILSILRERLACDLDREPLAHPVSGLKVSIEDTVPSTNPQRDFFHHHEEHQEKLMSFVDRLSYKIGDEKVFHARTVARYLPEKSWVKESGTESVPLPPLNLRPTRLLKKPRPLIRMNHLLIDREGKNNFQVTQWEGPERMSGEWWDENYTRDYFRVWTTQGQRLWIYITPESASSAWLHGFFD